MRSEPAELPPPPPPGHDDKLGDFYQVEKIVKKEKDPKTKRLRFLVEFEGYDDSENRWLTWQEFTSDMRKIATAMSVTEPETEAEY